MEPFINFIEALGFEKTEGKDEWTNADGNKVEICFSCGNILKIKNKEGRSMLVAKITRALKSDGTHQSFIERPVFGSKPWYK